MADEEQYARAWIKMAEEGFQTDQPDGSQPTANEVARAQVRATLAVAWATLAANEELKDLRQSLEAKQA